MNEIYFACIAFVIALFIGRLLIPRIVLLSMKHKLFDQPGPRKIHSKHISRLGGISFLPATIIAFSTVLFIMYMLNPEATINLSTKYLANSCLFIVGIVIIFCIGIIDDISGVAYRQKFIFQIIAAFVIVAPLLYVKNLNGIIGLWELPVYLSIPLSMIAVILIINAYNLIDGVDGLCSGLSIVTFVSLGAALLEVGEDMLLTFVSAMTGIVTAFFLYNAFGKRLKIFMGDTGSLILGYVIAYAALQYIDVSHKEGLFQSPYALVLGSIFVPVFDTVRLFVFRMIKGHSPFMPDKNHIHHKFLTIGLTHVQTTFTIIVLQIGYILLNALLSKHLNINTIIFIDICIGISINYMQNITIQKRKKHHAHKVVATK